MLFGVQDNQTEGEGDNEEDIQSGSGVLNQLNEESKREFNKLYGWLDLGLQVSKELNEPYLKTLELPAINVLTIASYLTAKVKQIQQNYK